MIRTLKVRVKDRHAPLLRAMSREVNTVWNYVNELSERFIRERRYWPTAYDLAPWLSGGTNFFEHVGSATIDEVRDVHAKSRRQARKVRLRWRRSFRGDGRHSLGWVPFKSRSATWRNGQVRFAGHHFKVWDSYGLADYAFRAGAFVAVAVECRGGQPDAPPVGIDPGLKNVATASDGRKCPSRRYRAEEARIGKAQRHARRKGRTRARRRVQALHAKVANRRKHDAHTFSRRVVNNASTVYMGAWTPPATGPSRWAKSARDGALASLKGMLRYKCEHAGIPYAEVGEAGSSRTCSACGHRHGNPRGAAWLGVRHWDCGGCGVSHDRDVNAAINILVAGAGLRPQ